MTKTEVPTDDEAGRGPGMSGHADKERVLALAAYGVPARRIAKVLGLTEEKLREMFGQELARGAAQANMQVAQSLSRKATGSGPQSVVAAIFWLKARAGWQDRPAAEGGVGAREAAARAAETAEVGTNWEELLR